MKTVRAVGASFGIGVLGAAAACTSSMPTYNRFTEGIICKKDLENRAKEQLAHKMIQDSCNDASIGVSDPRVVKLLNTFTEIGECYSFKLNAMNCAPVAGAPSAPTATATGTGAPAPTQTCPPAGVTYNPISISEAEQGSDVAITLPQGKAFNKPVLVNDGHHEGFALKNDGGVGKLTIPFNPDDQKATGKHVFIINDGDNHYELTINNIKPKRIAAGPAPKDTGGFKPPVVDTANPLGKPATIENPDKGK